jgi:hypothetical protein
MKDLITQAFLHVEGIGPRVEAGHYDLLGPHERIISPEVWETTIQPDCAITMRMWPMPEPSRQQLGGWSFDNFATRNGEGRRGHGVSVDPDSLPRSDSEPTSDSVNGVEW